VSIFVHDPKPPSPLPEAAGRGGFRKPGAEFRSAAPWLKQAQVNARMRGRRCLRKRGAAYEKRKKLGFDAKNALQKS
jgi:hypothetical protein